MSDTNSNNDAVVEVDVQTSDDLTTFEAEFYGKAKPEDEVEEVEEEVTDVDADADAEDDENDDEGDADEDEDEEEPDPKPKRNRKSAKERISELTAKNRETEAAANAAKLELEALKARLAKLEQPEKKEEVAPKAEEKKDDRPDPDALDEKGELKYPLGKFDPEFAADTVRWTMKMEREAAEAAAEARKEEEARQTKQNELVSSWNTKLEAAEEAAPGLKSKIAALETAFTDVDPTHGTFIAETIMGLERGPEVLAYLADNFSEAEAIVAASPVNAAITIGRIEARLPTNEPATKKVSTAPTPPVTTRGTGASKRVAPDTDDLEAFERAFYKR